jgi:hypothetical protein
VKIVACAPAPPIVFLTFQSMLTQTSDGTLVEDGGPGGPPPGVWRAQASASGRRGSRIVHSSASTLCGLGRPG